MGAERLPEIPEAAAEGSVAATYADMRRVLGLPIVNTVYRVLAVEPGRVERIWTELRGNLLSPQARAEAAELASVEAPPVEPLPAAALAVTGLDAPRAAATLTAYRRGNSHNALALWALLDGVDSAARPEPSEPAGDAPPAILPIADPAALPPSSLRLLEEMSEPIAGGERPLLVPGLLRHFAHDPCLLALLWTALRPALLGGGIAGRAAAVGERARELARGLPYPVTRLEDEEARRIVGRFTGAIAHMLIVGSMLEAALAEALPLSRPRDRS